MTLRTSHPTLTQGMALVMLLLILSVFGLVIVGFSKNPGTLEVNEVLSVEVHDAGGQVRVLAGGCGEVGLGSGRATGNLFFRLWNASALETVRMALLLSVRQSTL